nr:hypothetical protein [Candidatus Freyarchaeota archaeon]
MTNTTVENKDIGNEPLTRLEIASICLLVELGFDPQDAYTLVCELKAFSPDYHRRVLECTGLYVEARFALLHLLEELERTKPLENTRNQETLTKIPSGVKAVTNANIQSVALETAVNLNPRQAEKTLNAKAEKIVETIEKPSGEKGEEKILEELRGIAQEQEKAEEKILEKLREITQVEEKVSVSQDVKEDIPIAEHTHEEVTGSVSQDVKEDIPIAEQLHIPEHTSQEIRLENKEEIERWLSNTENHFEEMPVEKQEETMPRYIQLRTLTCKDKIGVSPFCIGCLINNTIDCPLFNRTLKKW